MSDDITGTTHEEWYYELGAELRQVWLDHKVAKRITDDEALARYHAITQACTYRTLTGQTP